MNPLAELQRAGLTSPEMMTVALTDACNLDCGHCWVDAGTRGPFVPAATEGLRQLFVEFARLGGRRLQLTGGEPLLHPDWRELLALAAAQDFERIVLQTNGLLLRPRDLQALAQVEPARLRIQISLDGAGSQTHDLVRGAGSFDMTLTCLRRLVEAGFAAQLSLFFTEMRHNLHELPELLVLAAALGIGEVRSGTLVPGGRATDGHLAPPRPEQYLELFERYRRDAAFRELYGRIGCVAALEWGRTGKQVSDCCRFLATPYLTASGRLYPCLMCHAEPYSVAGVFDKGLTRALVEGIPRWTELQRIGRRRAATIAACRACELHESCAAGCLGRTWGSCGDFQAVEDRCLQRLAVQRWIEKNGPL